jgi:pimeloyl-ACP methyl ester carboxylesterase
MPRIAVNGVELGYDEQGAGPPLVLLHAGVTDRRLFDDVVPLLAGRHRVIRYDIRSAGESQDVAGAYDPTDDLVAVLRELEAAPAHVVGVSGGATTAVCCAVRYPEACASLVACAAGAPTTDWPPPFREHGRQLEEAATRGDVAAAIDLQLAMWVDGPLRRPEQVDPGARALARTMLDDLWRHWQRADPSVVWSDPAVGERLHEIAVPTLGVAFALDHPFLNERAHAVGKAAPLGRVATLEGGAHLLPLEQPAAFAALLLEHTSDV